MYGFGYTGIISSMKKVGGGPAMGALTTAWIAATGETDTTIISALNTLETDLTAYGLTAKIKALYPMVGGTAAKHKFNFMDARDLDAAYRLTFNGGWTHSSTGALPNGTNAYANTFLTPLGLFGQNSSHCSYYSRTNSAGTIVDMGQGDYVIYSRVSTNLAYGRTNADSYATVGATDSLGLITLTRTASNLQSIYKDGVNIGTNSGTSKPFTAFKFVLGGNNNQQNPTGGEQFSNRECAFSTLGNGLTDGEASNLYTAVQNFNTTLFRQV